MAQAERISTAIRELMSRGGPLKSINLVRAAHAKFIAALAENAPCPIHSEIDRKAIEGRAVAALHVYLTAIIAEVAEKIPDSTLDRGYLDHLVQRFSAEALRVIRDAAAETRVHENWRAL